MKKILAILLAVLMCTGLLASAHTATVSIARSKMSDELLAAFDSISANETVTAIVEMTDVDHNEVMATFAKMYPEEFVTYIRAKFDNLEETEYAGILTTYPFSQYTAGEIDDDVLQRAIEHKRAIYAEKYEASIGTVVDLETSDNVLFASRYSPIAVMSLTESEAISLATDLNTKSVAVLPAISVADNEQLAAPYVPPDVSYLVTDLPLAHSITRADYVRDTKGNKGTGVKIGILEAVGLPDTNSQYLANTSIITRSGDTVIDIHATGVAVIMGGTSAAGTYYGSAPNASFYCCYNHSNYDFLQCVEWLVSSGVNVINASLNWNAYLGYYDFYSRWIDHVATQHDIHFVVTSGNDDTYVGPPGMAYNAITVGAFDQGTTTNVSSFELSSYSNFEEYDTQGLRAEKPNLVAPGTFETHWYWSGTSFAAPQVTATIAQLCSFNSSLKTRQALVGAILAASSALKIESLGVGAQGESFSASVMVEGNWQVSNREGAGMLDARWARGIVQYGNAWSYTIQGTSFPYTKTVTIDASANSVTRIAIFWLKRTSAFGDHLSTDDEDMSDPDLSNLDLRVYDPNGNLVAASQLTQANFEIVQFVPSVSGTYQIVISGSPSDKEHVGIAVW